MQKRPAARFGPDWDLADKVSGANKGLQANARLKQA